METWKENLFTKFQHPITKEPLEYRKGKGFESQTGEFFLIKDGIPRLRPAWIPIGHQFWRWVYSRIAFGYDLGASVGWRFSFGGAPLKRSAVIEQLAIQKGDLVLEVAVGTGENLKYLDPHACFVGVDISIGMLKRCERKFRNQSRGLVLVEGDAQWLPFEDGVFDRVFQVGALQFLAQPKTGILEMYRVLKPSGVLWVIDETASIPKFLPSGKGGFGKRIGESDHLALKELSPSGAESIQIDLISSGELFSLRIEKPG